MQARRGDHSEDRYKSFLCWEQYRMVVESYNKLAGTTYYLGDIDHRAARMVLDGREPGTYLIRNSLDRRYLYTLVLKTELGIKNLRIQMDSNSFYLENVKDPGSPVPHFDCISKLVDYYSICRDLYLDCDEKKIKFCLEFPYTNYASYIVFDINEKADIGCLDSVDRALPVSLKIYLVGLFENS